MFTLVFGLLAGSLIGIAPCIIGALKQRLALGIAGFFACVASGAILGLFLAVPVCGIFIFLIVRKKPSSTNTGQEEH